jgi:hypothetical protein
VDDVIAAALEPAKDGNQGGEEVPETSPAHLTNIGK